MKLRLRVLNCLLKSHSLLKACFIFNRQIHTVAKKKISKFAYVFKMNLAKINLLQCSVVREKNKLM